VEGGSWRVEGSECRVYEKMHRESVAGRGYRIQGYLAYKKPSTPHSDQRKTIGIGLLQGPAGRRFLMSEVPLKGVEGRGSRLVAGAWSKRHGIGPLRDG